MYCNNCGKQNTASSKFCKHCGVNFEEIDNETKPEQIEHHATQLKTEEKKRRFSRRESVETHNN